MRTRGRISASELTVIPVQPGKYHIRPPDNLDSTELRLFNQTVASMPANHFSAGDADLLVTYVRAVLHVRQYEKELAADKTLIKHWTQATRVQAQLASRLRLCPQARTTAKTAGRTHANQPPMSYYDYMAAQREADDDEA